MSNAYLPKTDRDVILDSLINDLEGVVEDLPWVDEEGYTTEHVTRGYAHALIANMALTRSGWMIRESRKDGYVEATDGNSDPTYPTMRCDDETRAKMYKIAEKHLTTVINSGHHSMNSSVEEYWRLMNICQLDPSHEAIFEIPMMLNKSGELGYTVGFRVSGASDFFGLKGNSTGKLKITAPYFWSFDHSGKDLRRDITCATIELRTKDDVFGESMLGNKPFALYCGKWDYRKMAENQTWLDAVRAGDANAKICSGINVVKMRYPHVLLMYAEACIELNTIDGLTLQYINMVRARAYKVDYTQTNRYPAVTTTDQTELRRILRNERRVEFAWEGRRYFDLMRWGWFEKAFSHNYYGLPNDEATLTAMENDGNWFWAMTPEIDEDGFADFSALAAAGYCRQYGERMYDPKIELWPIPYEEVALSGGKLTQNEGY